MEPIYRRTVSDFALYRCVIVLVLIGLTAMTPWPRTAAASRPSGIRRVTLTAGLQTDTAWSPDGEFIAYTSDESGAFNIWIQRSNGSGERRRITNGPDDDWQPQWAPDAKSLVFRSERDGGGLFTVDADGGQARRLTPFGYHPQWSPDGRRILFAGRQMLVMRQRQEFFVVPVSGGEPRQVTADVTDGFTTIPEACWNPDGKRITVAGVDVGQRVVIRTLTVEAEKGAFSEVDWTKGTDNPVYDIDGVMWARNGDALFLIGKDFGGAHAWRMTIDRTTGKRLGTPEDVIARANGDFEIALSPDGTRAAFTLAHGATRLRTYPLDSAQGRLTGSPRTITPANAIALAPDYTLDGKKLAYVLIPAPKPGQPAVRELHETTDAGDRILIADGAVRFGPRWSHDGRFISYRRTPAESRLNVATVLDTTTLHERQLTSPQVFATPFGWSADDKAIVTTFVHQASGRYGLFRLDVGAPDSSGTPLQLQSRYDLWQGTYSPDGRWIAFVVQEPEPRWSAIFVMRATGGPPIQITDGRGWDDKPRWSPDGRLLYFVTSHGGPFAVAAVRINPETGKAEGTPLQVLSLHAPREQVLNDIGWMEMALGRDAIALPTVERLGSIWTTSTGATSVIEPPQSACPNLQPPEAARRVMPSYSREAFTERLSGTVDLEALVDSDGAVRNVQVVRSPDVRLEPEALRAAAEWTFRPARCGNETISATTSVQVVFDRK